MVYFGGYTSGGNNSGAGIGAGGGGVFKPGRYRLRCPWQQKSSGNSNNSNTNLSASVRSSGCVVCNMYLVNVCTDDPNWWKKPWNITPCSDCNNNTSSDQYEKLENLCKKNKNGVIISDNKLPFTPAQLNAITEGNCNCIGNNNYEKCVLNDVFSECYSLGSQSDPAIAMLNLQMHNLMAENPALYAKAKCGDKSDSEVLKKLVSLKNTCGIQFLGVDFGILFDYYKANPGALSEGCDVALIANLKGKYPDMKNEIDGLLESGVTIEDINNLFNAYNPANIENKNNGPLMSNTVGICPSSFVFKPKSNNPSRVTTGITNLSMSFSFGGVTQ